ncbi:MAG TPA: NF038129 family PEP-CTERM protein [Candidatus Competibacteraceae bacterium]|nr:NF038129 family PEP-CTERM protein [Candidatus Competibacteraceae bacterium]
MAAFLWVAPLTASATVLHFTLETPSLLGTTAFLAFDFLDGDSVVNNTVTISDFATNGTLDVASPTGGASGTLIPGPVTLTDSSPFNSFLQALTLGTTLSFRVNLTEQPSVALFPDSFVFSLLNNTFSPLFATTDPFLLDALFAVDIDGSPSGALYPFAPTDTGSTVTWTVGPVASIPLPSTAFLIGAGLLGGLAARRRSGFCAVGRA